MDIGEADPTWMTEQLSRFHQDYRKISKVICLDKNYRQAVEGEVNNPYLEFLARLRRGKVNEDDIAMLQSRMKSRLSEAEQESFQEATWAFPTNALVLKRNK